jgi:FtsP/CotA-like multicopper oxidase with cupredoxin domain
MQLTRRDLLRWGIVLGGGAALSGRYVARAGDLPPSPPTDKWALELKRGQGIPEVKQSVPPFATFPDPQMCVNPDGTLAFHTHGPRAVPANTEFFVVNETEKTKHQFHPQLPLADLWGYDGQVPGPTFVGRTGTPQLVRFVNKLPSPDKDPLRIGEPISAVHRHGGFQAPEDDGYPLDTFCIGQSRDYFFPNVAEANNASTNWYHDHSIDVTGPNVYRGLSGFYVRFNERDSGNENDPSPDALRLPSGDFDIGLVLQDRRFDRNGVLVYDTFDHNGFIGDKFLVNGLVQPFLNVARRKYRFRVLNGSNARVYQLFLSDGQFIAIGTDSNLLPAPVTVSNFRVAPAERVEVVIDFAKYQIGDEIFLVNRLQQTDGRKPDGLVSPGTQLLKFVVSSNVDHDPSQVPGTLAPIAETPGQLLASVKVQRRFSFERSNGAWVINGQFFDENRVSARPRLGEPEVWVFESGGGWVHPVHVHLSTFFVLSRDGKQPPPLERGLKETILVGGDVSRDVRILVRFDDPRQAQEQALHPHEPLRYVFHCHNIEHEDMRMMAQFEVQT